MAVRDSLNDNAYEMYSMDNVLDSVDLTVSAWNRTTVADGQWLQDHAIGPLSARDVYLADQIDATNASIADITASLSDAGISTSGTGQAVGYAIKPLNKQLYPSAEGDIPPTLGDLPISLVSSGVDDPVISPYTVTYMTFGPATIERGGVDVSNMLGSVLTLHNGVKTAYQLAFSDKGMWYRTLTGEDVKQVATSATTASYIFNAPAFVQIPTDAITETKLNDTLTAYCKKSEVCATADIDTALTNKLNTTDFYAYIADAPTTTSVAAAAAGAYTSAKDYVDKNFATNDTLTSYVTLDHAETAYASNSVDLEVSADAPAITGGEKTVSAWLQEIANKINELATTSTTASE